MSDQTLLSVEDTRHNGSKKAPVPLKESNYHGFHRKKTPAVAPGFPESSQFCFLEHKEAIHKNLDIRGKQSLRSSVTLEHLT